MIGTIDTELRERMLRWAKGDTGATAGVQLLIDTGFLPERLAAAGLTIRTGSSEGNGVESIRWSVALDDDVLPELSHSEVALLEIAASLAGRFAVNLGRRLGVLDGTNRRHVVAALTQAVGR